MTDYQIMIDFTKIHAQGNSYIYLDYRDKPFPDVNLTLLALSVSNKNFGIGSDGMVIILKDNEADARMRIWNSDGSEAEMCGSALRTIVALLHQKSKEPKEEYLIKTAAGIFKGSVEETDDGIEVSVIIDNIKTITDDDDREEHDYVENLLIVNSWIGLPVSTGNPHFVIIDRFQEYRADITEKELIERIGPNISQNHVFPHGTNVELVKIVDPKNVVVRVWERGTGETYACGTGACAVVYAGLHLGFLDTEVKVSFPGGHVHVSMDSSTYHCRLTGTVEIICEGTYIYRDK